ncbi:MAG: GreA/GreB family elongation factor [Spirochaetes bacterium]|nr:GreA/GreB family elongation factor [Spirochaetota bacterium]
MHKGKVLTRYDYERLKEIICDEISSSGLDKRNVDVMKRDLDHSRLVDAHDIRPNIVTMNSKISLKNLGNGRKQVLSIVFPEDCNNEEDSLSVFSGMGMQIIGSPIGTVVKPNPADSQYFVIEDILYQPEAAGHYNM